MEDIGVIVASFDRPLYLARCVRSVLNKLRGEAFRVAVVDDASTNGQVHGLLDRLEAHPRVDVVRNPQNLGYAAAINAGMSFLTTRFGPMGYFLVLNQDTALLSNVHPAMARVMRLKPTAGILGPRLLNADGTVQNSFYAFHSPLQKTAEAFGLRNLRTAFARVFRTGSAPRVLPAFVRTHLRNFSDTGEFVEVPWIKGACLAIRADMVRSIGGFDEQFMMYAEDMDLCKRARAKGWKVLSVPKVQVVHHGGHRPAQRSPELVRLYYESLDRYYRKHFSGVAMRIMLTLNRIERWREYREHLSRRRQST